jgi:hypothetical protein
MVTASLVEANVKLGEDVYRALKRDAKLGVRGALWWFDAEASEWRFMIVADDYLRRGPRAAYSRVHSLLSKAGLIDQLPLVRVVVVPPDHTIPAELRKVVDRRLTPPPVNLALDNLTLPGLHVEAAYIYDI